MLGCDMIVVTVMDVLTTTLEYGSTPVFIVTVAVFVAFLASYRSSAGCTRVCTGIVCPLSIDSQWIAPRIFAGRMSHLLLHKYLYDFVGIESN